MSEKTWEIEDWAVEYEKLETINAQLLATLEAMVLTASSDWVHVAAVAQLNHLKTLAKLASAVIKEARKERDADE